MTDSANSPQKALPPMRVVDQWFEDSYIELLSELHGHDAAPNIVCTAFLGAKLDKIERRLRAIQNKGSD